MPDFLHEIVKDRNSRQEIIDWQSSIEHAIAQQDQRDPWEAELIQQLEQNIHYSGGQL